MRTAICGFHSLFSLFAFEETQFDTFVTAFLLTEGETAKKRHTLVVNCPRSLGR